MKKLLGAMVEIEREMDKMGVRYRDPKFYSGGDNWMGD